MGHNTRRKQMRLLRNEFLRLKLRNQSVEVGPRSCVMVLDNLKPDFNIGKILRSAAAFGLREVHVVRTPFFDPTPSKGAMKLIPVRFFDSIRESVSQLQARGYTVYGLAMGGTHVLGRDELPAKCAFVAGNEGLGLSFKPEELGVMPAAIAQAGRMDSLNVSVAASIAMYEYSRQIPLSAENIE